MTTNTVSHFLEKIARRSARFIPQINGVGGSPGIDPNFDLELDEEVMSNKINFQLCIHILMGSFEALLCH